MKIASIFAFGIVTLFVAHSHVSGGALPMSTTRNMNEMAINDNIGSVLNAETNSNACEDMLNKYRDFLLQSLYSFDDVCDVYIQNTILFPDSIYQDPSTHDGLLFVRGAPSLADRRSDILVFYKMLMTQLNDGEFSNILRNAMIDRCRLKAQQQRDEKRNGLVLGKKQRFHSWGGKRSIQYIA